MSRTLRSVWDEDGPLGPGRLPADDPEVVALAEMLGGGPPLEDLGGVMSLNVRPAGTDLVLRVHQPFVTRKRLLALRQVRRELGANGLVVAQPLRFHHRELLRCRSRWAELETFIPNTRAPATWTSYVHMFRAMGRLHHALAGLEIAVPAPVVSTYGSPASLRRWMRVTAASLGAKTAAAETGRWVGRLIGVLARQWIPSRQLQCQLIHGDVRLANIVAAPDGGDVYFDFGFAAIRPRIHELAYSLAWIVLRPDDSGTAEDFTWTRVAELIDAYQEEAGVVLDSIERRALSPYLAAVPLYLAAISGYTPDPTRHLLRALPFLRIADWVLSHPEALIAA